MATGGRPATGGLFTGDLLPELERGFLRVDGQFRTSIPSLYAIGDAIGGAMLAHKAVNIATMQLYRDARGGNAVMVLECDQEIPEESVRWLRHLEGIMKVTYLSLEEEKDEF